MKKQMTVLWNLYNDHTSLTYVIDNYINVGLSIQSVIPLNYSPSSKGVCTTITEALIIINEPY